MSNIPENTPTPEPDVYSTAPPWDDRTSAVIAIGFAGLLVVLGVTFWPIIPFGLSTAIIAYLLTPATNSLQKYLTFGRRGWAVLFTFVLIFIVITVVIVAIVPPLIEQTISGIASMWDTSVNFVREPVFLEADEPLLTDPTTGEAIAIWDYINILLREQGFDTVNEWLVATSQDITLNQETIQQFFSVGGGLTTGVLGSVYSIAGSTISLLLSALFFITILGSLLAGGPTIMQNMIAMVPDGYDHDARRLLADLGGVWDGYIRGNITLGLVMGFAMWLIAVVLGLPTPLFLASVAFATEFIPNIGPMIALVIAATVALAGGSSTFVAMNHLAVTGIVALAWFVMQQLEALVLVPRIVGSNLKLHPVIVILSVIWGGSIGGLAGVIVAPPLVASTRIIIHYIYGRLTGRTAFSVPEPPPPTPESQLKRLVAWFTSRRQHEAR